MKEQLRIDTESVLKKYQHMKDADSEAITSLIHELSVYQIELEMQNQSLKQAQEELLQSNINFYNLYHEAPVGYVILDKNDNVLKANKAFLTMIDLPTDKLLQKPLINAFTGDSRLILSRWLGSHLIGENEIDLTLTIAGQTRHLQVVTNEFSAFDDKTSRLLAFTDITSEVDLESRLELSFEIINTSKVACLVLDEQHNVHFLNQAFEKMTGYKTDDLLHMPAEILKSNRSFLNLDDIARKLAHRDNWTGPVWILANGDKTLAAHVDARHIKCSLNEYIVFRFSDMLEQV